MARTDDRFRLAFNRLLDICGRWDVGDQLPSEVVLASEMGVSRTVVRASLQRLSDEGLITWQGRSKTVVRKPLSADRLEIRDEMVSVAELERRFLEWVLRFDVPAGTALNVAQLSRQFNVPAHILQEFLAGLSRFGLVERGSKGGWLLLGFTSEFAIELSDFRAVLELNAVRNLVELPDDHEIWNQLSALKDEHLRLQSEIETRFHDFSKLDEKFHTAINSVVKNRFVLEAQKVISLIFHYHYMWDKTHEMQRNAAAIREHLDWIEAMESRDVERAEAAALRHLRTSKETLLSSLRDHQLV
ncbi:GntR family transcriptional regulator [uncultured Roseibium sp.]|uniref:GntR family transcriptional regulator n=1 Tax=uncultured Roseibium sp. TaxID=1936171 RepID=UPI0025948CF1|nr:GntR family transcriptional regulator [uncultured Roseibium sp.]